MDIYKKIKLLTDNYKNILSKEEIIKENIGWSNNGIGNRWLNGKFNYTVIYSNKKFKTYSDNEEKVDNNIILGSNLFDKNQKGIVGIIVHSKRIKQKTKRCINNQIREQLKYHCCVICGSSSDLIIDHKNDMYNDDRIENTKLQLVDDFQVLCNHCNLQKRQISKNEKNNKKLYSAKNIPIYKIYNFEFPWEKKNFDENDIDCKKDTFWYDPIEFNHKLQSYQTYILPIVREIKQKYNNYRINL